MKNFTPRAGRHVFVLSKPVTMALQKASGNVKILFLLLLFSCSALAASREIGGTTA